MSKYVIDKATLTAIGDAIREKLNTSLPVRVSEMPKAIGMIEEGESININALTFTGDCETMFAYPTQFKNLVSIYGDRMVFKNITSIYNMFQGLSSWLFLDNLTMTLKGANARGAFKQCRVLKTLPKVSGSIKNLYELFYYCHKLPDTEINNFFKDLTYDSSNASYTKGLTSAFQGCHSARSLSEVNNWIQTNLAPATNFPLSFNSTYCECYMLDTLDNVPVLYNTTSSTNCFDYTFIRCSRVKDIIFQTDNGTPYTVNWSNQNILINQAGFANSGLVNHDTMLESGADSTKEITDDATYQALKDDADSWTMNVNYSRYNHDSAVRTINSLPDTSNGSGNVIRFGPNLGSLTDGGAINTLTTEEIAVATAKGWTIGYV